MRPKSKIVIEVVGEEEGGEAHKIKTKNCNF
jgi:hypothetical protein